MRRPESPAAPLIVAVAAAAALAGCATSSLELAPQASDHPWQPQTAPSGEIVPGAAKVSANAAGHDYTLPANPALAAVPPPAALDPAHAYTLPELIDLAESTNPLTRIAWNDARNAALAVGIAKTAYLPHVSATAMGGYQAGHGSTSTQLGSASTDTSVRGTISALSLQWLLFDFGGRAARVEAAEQASIVSNVAFTAVHQQVIHDVTVAYYRYEASRSRARSAEQSLANADAIVAAARARLKQGVGTVVEAAQATQNRAQANLALVEARGAESDGYLGLVSALGISPLSKPTIAALPARPLPPALRTSVDAIVADAIARRPDLQSAYALEKADRAKVKAAEAEFMPKVFMSASTSYSSGRTAITALPAIGQQAPTVNLNGSRYGGGVFVGVTIPLYDGGLRSAVLMQARNDAESASARLTRTKEEAVRQVVAAQNALQTSLASNEAAKALVDAAQTSYDAALTAYRNGVGSVTDATLAQSQLLAARNADVDSYCGALSAAAALALATGTIGAAQ
ncbi:TolC family protein [Burkholderia stagnalis]|uniref:TolC family protein n=1 Tax=Burkholderia stagnalis TaxID=1503054 RepID=UPI00075709EC|nr:TolC family protein [Burkholderia stagnalis]KVO54031.1 RND transporter [Burkholderia stagnalis]KVP07874.1 RND transporter [Burkholderia stagnalis]KVW89795.1 RND transporter [Burkholderia stagnalis]KWH67036.1 RND transporter [Burkholderia stagnalis]KWK55756.1 RND transporter [Burkholderia stagnalis]